VQVNAAIFVHQAALTPEIPIFNVFVKGARCGAFLDSGVRTLFPQLRQLPVMAGVVDERVRYLLVTHPHHDHIGSNRQMLATFPNLLIGCSPWARNWIADFAIHWREFGARYPEIIAPTPQLYEELMGVLDGETEPDLLLQEGNEIDLGGGVLLRLFDVPGHMPEELAFFEVSTRTLLIGDAIPGTAWTIFHGYLAPGKLRSTLAKLRRLCRDLDCVSIILAHFGVLSPAQFLDLIDRTELAINQVDDLLLETLRQAREPLRLEELWRQLCLKTDKQQEFRGLTMVDSILKLWVSEGKIRQVGPDLYESWSASQSASARKG